LMYGQTSMLNGVKNGIIEYMPSMNNRLER